jgi:hypothetical protein
MWCFGRRLYFVEYWGGGGHTHLALRSACREGARTLPLEGGGVGEGARTYPLGAGEERAPPPFSPRAQPDLLPSNSITLIFRQCGYITFSPPLRLGTVARTCDRGGFHRNAVDIPDPRRFPLPGSGTHLCRNYPPVQLERWG